MVPPPFSESNQHLPSGNIPLYWLYEEQQGIMASLYAVLVCRHALRIFMDMNKVLKLISLRNSMFCSHMLTLSFTFFLH